METGRGLPAPKPPATSVRTGNNPRGVAIAPPPRRPVYVPRPPSRPPSIPAPHRAATMAVPKVTPKQAAAIHAGVSAVAGAVSHGTHAVAHHTVPTATPRQREALAVAQRVSQALSHADSLTAPSEVHISSHGVTDHLGSSIGGPAHGAINVAAISNPHLSAAELAKYPAGVLGNLGKDIVNFAPSTIEGGAAIAHGLIHPKTLPHLLSEMYHQDALAQALTLHFGRAGHLAATHPLGAISDVAGAAGIAGRVAGAAGRAGGLEAATARPGIELPGGITGIARRPHPNLFTNMLLRKGDTLIPRIHPKIIGSIDSEFRRRADEHHLLEQEMIARYEHAARERGGANTTARQIKKAREQGRKAAVMDTLEQNALRNPRNGTIFYGKTTKPAAVAKLEAQGHKFVKVPANQLLGRRNNAGAVHIPEALFNRMMEHRGIAVPKTEAGRVVQQGNRMFRESVLPFSSKWFAGNTIEGSLRTGLVGANPIPTRLLNPHISFQRKVVDLMRHEGLGLDADRLEAHTLQGSHYAMNERLDRELQMREAGTSLPRKAGHAYHHGIHKIFEKNAQIERQFSRAVLGKHMAGEYKRIKAAHPSLTEQEALARLAHHYARPEVAAEAGRFSRKTLGKYNAFGPSARSSIRTVTPFAPWYVNSAKFMGTLPFRHPLPTAAVLAAARASDPQWAAGHKSVKGLPGSLLADVPVGPHGFLDPGRYTPPGAFTAGTGKKLGSAISATLLPILFPQYQGIYNAMQGLDPYGNQLQYPGPGGRTPSGRVSHAKSHYSKGQGDTGLAISELLGSILGPAQPIHRIAVDRGGTPYSSERLWDFSPQMKNGGRPFDIPGLLAGLRRVYDPFRATQVVPHAKSKRSGGGGFNFGGGSGGGGSSGGFNFGG